MISYKKAIIGEVGQRMSFVIEDYVIIEVFYIEVLLCLPHQVICDVIAGAWG